MPHICVRCALLALLLSLLLYPAALPAAAEEGVSALEPAAGACPPGAFAAAATDAARFRHYALREIAVTRDWPAAGRPLLALPYPYYGEVAVLLPGAADWAWRSPLAADRDRSWPGYLAVWPLPDGLRAGDLLRLCLRYNTARPLAPEIALEDTLRARELRRLRSASLAEGTLLAMCLAGLGMALALRNAVFMAIGGGLAFALLYLATSNGTLLDWPLAARIARDWPLQVIGGIGANLLLLWGLARYLDLRRRHPLLWRLVVLILWLLLLLLAAALLPSPLRFASLARYSNPLLPLGALVLVGTALDGAWRGHEPSRVFLWSWTPLALVVTWMTALQSLTQGMPGYALLLFPLCVIYACGFLFIGLARRLSEVQAQRDLATLRAETDALTGALSRPALDSWLQRLCDRAYATGRPFAVLFIDFDHFKRVNDDFGHRTGDRALAAGAQRVAANLRDVDRIGRYGGEEFLALLEGLGARGAAEVAERIRTDIENGGVPLSPELPPLTVSIGVAAFDPASREPPASLLRRADEALYAAKSGGRNRVESAEL